MVITTFPIQECGSPLLSLINDELKYIYGVITPLAAIELCAVLDSNSFARVASLDWGLGIFRDGREI